MFKSFVSRKSRVLSFQLTRCKTAKAASMGVGRRTPSQKRAVNAPFPNSLAIRREDKNRWERRAPLTPEHVKKLVDDGLKVFVQPSTLRIFPDAEYEKAGAEVTEDLSVANVILAVKEVPIHKLIPNRTYMFFSHTIKAQEYNMPMLDAILENNIRLFDYERIVDKDNTRLVRFGRYAGYAGMIDFLHGFGNRLLAMGYSTPFLHIGYTHMYSELDNARDAVKSIGRAIAQGGLPRALGPLIFTFTGSGSVSEGARHMFEFLPHKWVKPDELKKLTESRDFDNRVVYGCLATTPDIVEHKDGSDIPVDRQDYYKNPDQYRSTFAEKIAPYTSVLVNCLYWDQRYPRLLTVSQAENLTRQHRFRMIGLADLSADPGGSVEFMQRLTTIDFPFYVYDLENHEAQDNVATAKGVMICSIDNLPTEIPYEASQYFGDSLLPFVSSLARSNQSKDYAAQLDELAPELRDAMITSQGELTPPFQYIAEFRRRNAAEKRALSSKHKVLVLGSGMVTEPLVKYLTSFDSLFVTVASNDVNAAEDIVRGRRRTDSVELDVNDEASLRSLVRQHDVVVSLLPATMHVPIAKLCIAERRHLVTTSYTSPEMAALHDEARAAGVTVLNEIGLDPGIDHLLAMRVINEAEQRGARLTSFVSHCGGLPAPEASGNPFGYKFSWSPLGVLAAGTNSARFRIDNETVELESGTLFSHAEPYDFLPGFNTEALPNRDSLHYAKVYGVPDASTFLRGTLRYRGFSLILDAITQLGLVDKSKNAMFAKGAAPIAWRSAIAAMLPDFAGYDVEAGVIRHLQLDAPGRESEASAVIGAMRWLGLFSSKDNVPQCGSPIESLAAHMHARMGYEKGERDLVLLKHQFVLQEADGSERRQTSSLVVYGDESGTAMARTVGTPAAIAAKLILDEHVIRRGVITPITPDLYYPLLSGLEAAGIKSVEAEVDH